MTDVTDGISALRDRRHRVSNRVGHAERRDPGRDRLDGRSGPTLGEALIRRAGERGHDILAAARALDTSRGNVWQWSFDRCDPCPENFLTLMDYLGLTDDELGGLIVRSQLRRFRNRSLG